MGCLSKSEINEIKSEVSNLCKKYNIPNEIKSIINQYSISSLFCDICQFPLESEYENKFTSRNYKKSVSWSVYGSLIKCNRCSIPLSVLYKNRKMKKKQMIK